MWHSNDCSSPFHVHLNKPNEEDVSRERFKTIPDSIYRFKKGVHYFDYEISQEFFSFFEASPVHESEVNILLRFEKKEDFFILKFDMGGSVKVACDRCLERIRMPFEADYTVYVKFENERFEQQHNEEENDIIFIAANETEIDVSQLIYEFFHLSMPMRKNCEDFQLTNPPCNQDVLEYLNNDQKENSEEIDPRWEALKNLKRSN